MPNSQRFETLFSKPLLTNFIIIVTLLLFIKFFLYFEEMPQLTAIFGGLTLLVDSFEFH